MSLFLFISHVRISFTYVLYKCYFVNKATSDICGRIWIINTLKPNVNYMYHLLQQQQQKALYPQRVFTGFVTFSYQRAIIFVEQL